MTKAKRTKTAKPTTKPKKQHIEQNADENEQISFGEVLERIVRVAPQTVDK